MAQARRPRRNPGRCPFTHIIRPSRRRRCVAGVRVFLRRGARVMEDSNAGYRMVPMGRYYLGRLAHGRPGLIVTDSRCRLHPATPRKRRFRCGVKYRRLIFGALSEFAARHLFVTLVVCGYGDTFKFSRRSIFQSRPYRQS